MSAYPTISGVVIVSQFPYEEVDNQAVAHADLESGFSITRPIQSAVVKRWVLNYSLIQKDDADTLEAFYDSTRGRLGEFDFTDDQGVVWHHTRFDSEFNLQYQGPNHYSLVIKLSAEKN